MLQQLLICFLTTGYLVSIAKADDCEVQCHWTKESTIDVTSLVSTCDSMRIDINKIFKDFGVRYNHPSKRVPSVVTWSTALHYLKDGYLQLIYSNYMGKAGLVNVSYSSPCDRKTMLNVLEKGIALQRELAELLECEQSFPKITVVMERNENSIIDYIQQCKFTLLYLRKVLLLYAYSKKH